MGYMADLCTLLAAMSATNLQDMPGHAGVVGPSVPVSILLVALELQNVLTFGSQEPLSPFQGIPAFNEGPEGSYGEAAPPVDSPLQEESADSFEHNIFPAPSTPLVVSTNLSVQNLRSTSSLDAGKSGR